MVANLCQSKKIGENSAGSGTRGTDTGCGLLRGLASFGNTVFVLSHFIQHLLEFLKKEGHHHRITGIGQLFHFFHVNISQICPSGSVK